VRLRGKLLVVSLAGMLVAAGRDALADAQADLEKAHSAYVAHKYDEAETRLRALLESKKNPLKDPDSVADARMYLGAVLVAEGKKDEAGRTFEQLLLDKPDYQPDPLRVSLEASDAFIDARTRLRDRLAAIREEEVRKAQLEKAKAEAERQKAAARLAMLEKLASTEIVVERHSRWLALVPFGVGQFQNGQDTLGWAFLSSEVLLAVGSVGGASVAVYEQAQANDAVQRHDPDAVAREYEKRAQLAAIVTDLFSAGFFAAAIGGVVHAQLTFVPERVETRKREIPPLSLSPVVGLGVLGLRATF
jgi:hypothetical protein